MSGKIPSKTLKLMKEDANMMMEDPYMMRRIIVEWEVEV